MMRHVAYLPRHLLLNVTRIWSDAASRYHYRSNLSALLSPGLATTEQCFSLQVSQLTLMITDSERGQ